MTGPTWEIRVGDCRDLLAAMPGESVATCVTSPPYFGLRDYGHDGQIGLESTPDEYVANLVDCFRAVRRCLHDKGTLWLNLGDSYWTAKGAPGGAQARHVDAKNKQRRFGCRPLDRPPPSGIKAKDLVGIPWRVALALQADGWYLRADVVWSKPNATPEPTAKDRPSRTHEYVFLLSKSRWYDCDAGGLKSSVWSIPTQRSADGHPAVFPTALIEPCILAGSREGDTVLDPFSGAGTTGTVALRYRRSYVGLELNPAYASVARERIILDSPLLNGAAELVPHSTPEVPNAA